MYHILQDYGILDCLVLTNEHFIAGSQRDPITGRGKTIGGNRIEHLILRLASRYFNRRNPHPNRYRWKSKIQNRLNVVASLREYDTNVCFGGNWHSGHLGFKNKLQSIERGLNAANYR